jgi:hypothetical protein
MRAYLRERGITLGPREVRELQAAFDKAWRHAADTRPTSGAEEARLRDRLAHAIIRLRQRGVRDQKRLTTLAIEEVTATKEQQPPPRSARRAKR